MSTKRILLWYRNDLRLHDHQPLTQALKEGASVIPLYCFDDRHFGQTRFGFPKTGAYRAQFLLESRADLQHAWQTCGRNLIIPELVDRLRIYKETRNGMLGADYSSKFSAWLALGCLSPRYINQQVKKYETERIENDSTLILLSSPKITIARVNMSSTGCQN